MAETRSDPISDANFATPASDSGRSFWSLLVLLLAAGVILVVLQGRRQKPTDGEYVGEPLPPLDAGGWINTKSPLTANDLRGKVVLVDFWASDCMPCVHHIPALIEFNRRYRDQGVMLVGLSNETGQRAQHLKNLIAVRDGLDWPVAFDAQLAYQVMDIIGTPTYLLYDRTGRSVWGGHSLDGLEEAVTAALAKQ